MHGDNLSLRILGLDPGSRYTGYGIIDRHGSRLTVIDHGRIRLPDKLDLPQRLAQLVGAVSEIIGRASPQVAVLESLFRGVNPKSLIVLAQARGAILASLAIEGLDIEEYSPAEIKSALTGNGRADKQQVAKMVRLVLGLGSQEIPEDATDALAVAVCFAQRSKLDRLARK